MPQQQAPWLETAYGWAYGENGWNIGMDSNLLKFSVLFDCNVDSIVASLPSAVNGKVHYLTTDNRLYFAVGTTYFSTALPRWFEFKDRLTGNTYQFNGTAAVVVNSPAQVESRLNAVELTITSLGSAAYEDIEFFATQASLDVVEASSQAYTDVLRQDLIDESGAGILGFDDALTYPVDSVGARLLATDLSVDAYGASPSNADNTSAYNALIAAAPEGATIRWGKPGQVYIGNFSSPTKSLRLDLNGAILRDFTTVQPVVAIGSLSNVVAHPVVEASLAYGATSFQVVGAAGLFAAGDIGYLWDSASRPSDTQSVNFECVKIRSVVGDVVSIEGFLASYKGAGAINFYRDPNQLKGVEVFGGTISPSASHTSIGVAAFNCDGVRVHGLETTGTTGDAVSIRFCYDVLASDIKTKNPTAVGSGQGYGVSLLGVSQFGVYNVLGHGMRHAYDQDSAYFGKISAVTDLDDRSACVTLAHNGFAGHIDLDGVTTKTLQYPVTLSSQGYDGATAALRGNHPFRAINIRGVDATIDATISPNSAGIFGVYFQNSVIDSSVRDVSCNILSADAVTLSAVSSIVRVDGIAKGTFEVSGLSANKVGRALFATGNRGTLAVDSCIAKVSNIHLGACAMVSLLQGSWAASFSDVAVDTAPAASKIFGVDAAHSSNPRGVYVGHAVSYFGSELPVITTSNFMDAGALLSGTRGIGSGLTVADGQAVTQAELQNRSARLLLLPPSGAGTTTLSATAALPPPVVLGQEVQIITLTGRNSVVLPAGNNLHAAITIAPGEQVRLVGYASKWGIVARSASV